MGLDMYLYKGDSEGNCNWEDNEIMCWRKAKQIHNWMVINIQNSVDDCGDYILSKEKAKELLENCKKIIEKCNIEDNILQNQELANALLPSQSGFFFGNTDYDEYYLSDIQDTYNKLTEILENFEFDNHTLVYTSSW